MSKIETGGPAFPLAASEYGGNGPEWGMTMRDYFAAKAMQGMISSDAIHAFFDRLVEGGSTTRRDEYFAQQAYAFADAMLRAREAQ